MKRETIEKLSAHVAAGDRSAATDGVVDLLAALERSVEDARGRRLGWESTWTNEDEGVCVAYAGHVSRGSAAHDARVRIARHIGYGIDEIDPADIRFEQTVKGADPTGEYVALYGPLPHNCPEDYTCVVHPPEVENGRDFEDFDACRCADWCPGEGEDIDPIDPTPVTVFTWEAT